MSESLDTLLPAIRACRLCEACLPLEPRPILQAHPQSRILIAAQAPGTRAHDTWLPFNDPSGDRLRSWLGVSRETFYTPECFALAPMGFCYPGRGKSGDLPPRPECAPTWRPALLAGLEQVQRSEERRVGKECRSRGWRDHSQKNQAEERYRVAQQQPSGRVRRQLCVAV